MLAKSYMALSVYSAATKLNEIDNGERIMSSLAHQLQCLFIFIKAYTSMQHVMLA